MAMSATAQGKLVGFLALAIPVLAGVAYLAVSDAPSHYSAINAGALGLAAVLLAALRAPENPLVRRALIGALLLVMFLPLVTGPSISGIARWLPLGPFTVHAGMLAVPPLIVLAAHERNYTPPILLAGVFAALIQPDAASGFALTFAAVGLHDRTRDWKIGLVVVIGFVASLLMAVRGELPAQPYVEHVLADAALDQPLVALGLFLALLSGFLLMLFAIPGDRPTRFALAGSLFGFSIIALMENYPSALIGYGAAPIVGYGLALAMMERRGKTAS